MSAETAPPSIPELVPILPLKEAVALPLVATPLVVGQERSRKLIEEVMQTHRIVGLVLQKHPEQALAGPGDLRTTGTIAYVDQVRRADGTVVVLVQGLERMRLGAFVREEPYLIARVERWPDQDETGPEVEALARSCRALFREVVESSPTIPGEAADLVDQLTSSLRVAYVIASAAQLSPALRQELLETDGVAAKLRRLLQALQHELEVQKLEQKISAEAREKLTDQQRKYMLRERLHAIQKELGEEGGEESAELSKRIDTAGLPPEVRAEVDREVARLAKVAEASPEHGMVRSWLDTVLALPWKKRVGGAIDLRRSREVLDADHYDLDRVKERILEHLAVKRLREERRPSPGPGEPAIEQWAREPILCFVGPPGVGKTSLGQSIARAMGRKFIRISLGGIRDEAEIRGHRRTYIGAMPGRIIQALRRAESANPVFMLDEVDKLNVGFMGDPAAALLEVLDPAQNQAFVDTYVNLPFDLSQVLFICTANTTESIPAPLLDRMEVLQLSGYTDEEKLQIARRYLLPRQLEANGLVHGELEIGDRAIRRIMREYTREAGVRNLERELGAIARKAARRIGEAERPPILVRADDVPGLLGKPRVFDEVAERVDRPGVATGLAWTPAGGDVLFVEAQAVTSRKEDLLLTGMLGDVMRESAQAALTYLRANAAGFGIDSRWFERRAIHLHVPAGATPKDGPSAGVTILVALASMATGAMVRPKVAMTGEITLRGKVLPVGGIKEKVLAAHRVGIETVIMPRRNERDLDDIPAEIRGKLRVVLVDSADEVLREALEGWGLRPPEHAPAPEHLM
ncbi:MAG: endopeptidase La [Myxococcaceae bacterium]